MNEVKVAIIDLYNNERNEGMRCIKEIVSEAGNENAKVMFDVFESRYKGDVPSIDYDIIISSGGPGSPFEDEGKKWEKDYFKMVDSIWNHNQKSDNKKYLFFICHSFQLMARHFKFAEVNSREKKSFGVHPVNLTEEGKSDPLFLGLNDPFFAADFRQFQVVNKDQKIFDELNASVLAIENDPAKDPNDLALMGIRISNEIAGTQFHPEADAESMIYHLKQDERKQYVFENYGEQRYYEMLNLLQDPEAILLTRKTVLPSFLQDAINKLNEFKVQNA